MPSDSREENATNKMALMDGIIGRPAPGGLERSHQGIGKAFFFLSAEETTDGDPAAFRDQVKPLDAKFRMRDAVKPHPQRIEGEFHHMAAVADPPHMKLRRRQANFLAGFGAAKADAEGPVDREHVEAEKADYGPGAHQQERNAGGKTHHADKSHHHQEASAVERAVRR